MLPRSTEIVLRGEAIMYFIQSSDVDLCYIEDIYPMFKNFLLNSIYRQSKKYSKLQRHDVIEVFQL